jgi:hypothetical protein
LKLFNCPLVLSSASLRKNCELVRPTMSATVREVVPSDKLPER